MSVRARPCRVGPAIAICIPARNEAARLPRLFAALERLAVPDGAMLSVCLMLDGCTDDSAAIADAYRLRSRHRVAVAEAAPAPSNAGRARDAAMRLGIAVASDAAILLTTDADSVPATDWVATMVGALDHAEVVAGNVLRDGGGADAGQDRIERYYADLFALRRQVDPVAWEAPRPHHHASGANMGLSAATYRTLGGFAPLEHGEDARLADDAARAGFRVRRDAASIVHTSARRTGRARGGLAATLRDIDRRGLEGVVVAHPVDQLWQYRMHALARSTFATGMFAPLAAALALGIDHLTGVARDCPNAEAFAMRVVPVPTGGMRHIAFATAEATLAGLAACHPAEAA